MTKRHDSAEWPGTRLKLAFQVDIPRVKELGIIAPTRMARNKQESVE